MRTSRINFNTARKEISFNHDNQADVEAFNSTSRYRDDLLNIDNPYLEGIVNHISLNIDNPYLEGMVNHISPPERQLNKANTSDTKTHFLYLHLSVANGLVSFNIYDKRDDFDFDIRFSVFEWWRSSSCSLCTGVQLVFFFCSGVRRLFGAQGSPSSGSLLNL